MSGNQYRRGGRPSQYGQHGGANNGDMYHYPNSQYRHGQNAHNYNRHSGYRENEYQEQFDNGYYNQYDRYGYQYEHPNARYPPHGGNANKPPSNGNGANTTSPRHSFSSSGVNGNNQQSPSLPGSSSTASTALAASTQTADDKSKSKGAGSFVKNAQLFSSRRSRESSSTPSSAHGSYFTDNRRYDHQDYGFGGHTSSHQATATKYQAPRPFSTDSTTKSAAKPSHTPAAASSTTSKEQIANITSSIFKKTKKKPLDINGLQPMKKKKKVEDSTEAVPSKTKDEIKPKSESSKPESNTESETIKEKEITEPEEITPVETKIKEPVIEKIEKEEILEKKEVIEKKEEPEVKATVKAKKAKEFTLEEEQLKEEFKVPTKQKEESSDDEDEPIHSKSRNVSVDTSDKSMEHDSEAETDIEDSIPVPSRKTRRLHRLLQTSSSVEGDEKAESTTTTPNKITVAKRNSNTSSTSNSRSSRSQSPKQRKTSRAGRDASGRTLLQRMCAKGNYDEAKRLIEEGANIDDADFAGTTPLHEAALEGYHEITQLLLDNGANIDVQSGQMDKDTPLIDAVSNIHYKVVQLLLKRGANPTIQNAQGENALDALENAFKELDDEDDEDVLEDAKKIRKLLNQYVKNFAEEKDNVEPIVKSKKTRERTYSNPSDDDQHSYASLRKGGSNSLQERISANDVTFVLNYVSSMNGKKIPPESLLLASKLGFPDIASLLIAFGADINFKDKKGLTPLILAVGKGHLEMVKLLLSNQANVSLKDKKGRTALDILKENNLVDSEEYRLISAKMADIKDDNIDVDNKDDDEDDENDDNAIVDDQDEEEEDDEDEEEDSAVDETFHSSSPEKKRSYTKKRKSITEEDDEEDDIEEEIDHEEPRHVSKKQKIAENITASPSPSPSPLVKKSIHKQKKKQDEEAEEKKHIPTPPTAEELEAQRLREIEAQKAREALEQQRSERKKLKQQEIAKRIDAFEKQREEEKKALERETLEKKRKEEEEQNKILLEQEKSRKKEEIKYAIEKRKLIRSYYPFGLKNAVFNGELSQDMIEKYLPLYVFKIGGEEYLIDLQLNLVLGVESLYSKYSQLAKKQARYEEKKSLWNFLWPLIGSFTNKDIPIDKLQNIYKAEGENFKELVINWIKLDDFKELLKSQEQLAVVDECIQHVGYCRATLASEKSTAGTAENVSLSTSSSKDVIDLEAPATVKEKNTDFPLRFGKRTRTALKMMNKPLW